MRAFIQRHLDPAGRLGEVLFGLIMALGFTGAVRLGHEEADNYALFVGIFGCNLAWAIVDGVMYVMTELFERGRKARLAREVASARSEEAALEQIAAELEGPLMALAKPEERRQFYRWVLAVVRREQFEPARIHREDLLGGAAVALVILLATFLVVAPYLLVPDPNVAVRISHSIALILLFLLGARWAQLVGGNWFRIASGLTLFGVVLVLITIALGG